ncbi:hypothetical protein FRC16_008712, partial [Serendipita sp. 398]
PNPRAAHPESNAVGFSVWIGCSKTLLFLKMSVNVLPWYPLYNGQPNCDLRPLAGSTMNVLQAFCRYTIADLSGSVVISPTRTITSEPCHARRGGGERVGNCARYRYR